MADGAPLRIAFLASRVDGAQRALEALAGRHGQHDPADADILVALGGDGFMLQTLHRHGALGKPVYGMKLGSVGFLMNQYRDDGPGGPGGTDSTSPPMLTSSSPWAATGSCCRRCTATARSASRSTA